MLSDQSFDMDKFVRKVLGGDPSVTFGAQAVSGEYHRERQGSIHADYDENGQLVADPFAISEQQARRSVEMAWFAAQIQTLWVSNWRPNSGPEGQDGNYSNP